MYTSNIFDADARSAATDGATPDQRHRAVRWVDDNVSRTTDHNFDRAYGKRLREIIAEEAAVKLPGAELVIDGGWTAQ